MPSPEPRSCFSVSSKRPIPPCTGSKKASKPGRAPRVPYGFPGFSGGPETGKRRERACRPVARKVRSFAHKRKNGLLFCFCAVRQLRRGRRAGSCLRRAKPIRRRHVRATGIFDGRGGTCHGGTLRPRRDFAELGRTLCGTRRTRPDRPHGTPRTAPVTPTRHPAPSSP